MKLVKKDFLTEKALKKADQKTYLIRMKGRFVEEFDDESNRLDVFSVYVLLDKEYYSAELVKFVFTKKTGKLVYSKEIE